jgi:hypothetical protein
MIMLFDSDEKTYSQMDHILINTKSHSNAIYVQSFRGAGCDNTHYLASEKIMKVFWAKQKFNVETFNLRKLNNVELKAQYKARISNTFVALGNLDKDVHINRIHENDQNLKSSAKNSLDLL